MTMDTKSSDVIFNMTSYQIKMTREYLFEPLSFDTILIYLYMCVILVSVNISE